MIEEKNITEDGLPILTKSRDLTDDGLPILKKKDKNISNGEFLKLDTQPAQESQNLSQPSGTNLKYTWSDSQPLKTASVMPHPNEPKTKIQTISDHTANAALDDPDLYNNREHRIRYVDALDLPKEEKEKAISKFDIQAKSAQALRDEIENVKKNPNNPEPQLNVIGHFIALGKPEQANKFADQVIATHPDWSPAYSYKAKIEADRGNYANGIDIINQGIKNNPIDASLYANRALIKSQSGDMEGSIKDLDSGIGLTKNPHVLENLWTQKAIIFKKLLDSADKPNADKLIEEIHGVHNPHIDETNKDFFSQMYHESVSEASKYAIKNKAGGQDVDKNIEKGLGYKYGEEFALDSGLPKEKPKSFIEQAKVQAQADLTNKILNPDKPLSNYILGYITEHGKQIYEGAKELGKAVSSGETVTLEELQKPKVGKEYLKQQAHNALDAFKGGADVAFGAISFTPAGAAFNVGIELLPEEVNKWAFSPAHSIAEQFGYQPKEGSLAEKALSTADIVGSLALMHGAGKLLSGKGNDSELKQIQTKLEKGEELTKEDASKIREILNDTKPEELKEAITPIEETKKEFVDNKLAETPELSKELKKEVKINLEKQYDQNQKIADKIEPIAKGKKLSGEIKPEDISAMKTEPLPKENYVNKKMADLEKEGEISPSIPKEVYEKYFSNLYDRKYVKETPKSEEYAAATESGTTDRGTSEAPKADIRETTEPRGQGVLPESPQGGVGGAEFSLKDKYGSEIKVGDKVKTQQPGGGVLPQGAPEIGVVEKTKDAFGKDDFQIRYRKEGDKFDRFILLNSKINEIVSEKPTEFELSKVRGKDKIAEGVDELARSLGIIKSIEGGEKPDTIKALVKIGEGLIEEGIATAENVWEKVKEHISKLYPEAKIEEHKEAFLSSIKPEKIVTEGERKKSLIGRVYEGITPDEIRASVEKHGLNYSIETHPEAARLADNFVKEVGIDNAIEAVRNNQVEGGAAPFVWATAIDNVYKQFLSETNPEIKAQLAKKESDLIDEFDKKARSSGRFSSSLHPVYQVSDLGYKLGTILNRAKEANLGEAVPEILKKRLSDLSEKLDDVNKRIAENEKSIGIDTDKKILEEVDKIVKGIHEKLPTERRRKADKAIAALEGIQAKLRSNAYSSIVPLPIIDAGISVIKSAIKAGVNIADAVEMGINHIKERYGKDWERENDFRKDVLDELKKQNIDFKKEPKDKDSLDEYKNAIRKSIEKNKKRLEEKDFSQKMKPEKPKLDKEGFELLVEKNKLKDEVDVEIEKLKLRNRSLTEKVEDGFVDAINLPKSLMASADMSAPLRQGAVLGAAHPIIAGKSVVEMFKQAFSEEKAIDWLTRLRSTPEYEVMKESGLYISEPTAKLSAKEEQFISNIAHKIPIWGKVVKGSERAYTGYLNKLRVDVFSQFHDGLIEQGIKGEQLNRELESFAEFVNNASGRGSLGRFEDSAAGLNAGFFSPRYAISRFNLINPYEYVKMAPKARAEALKTLGIYIGMGSTVLMLAKAAGADVVLDPRSSDFGKIKIGDTRIDIWSGFQQWVRLIAQLASGEKTTLGGRVQQLGKGYKSDDRLDVLGRFLRYKTAPAAGFGLDVLAGKNAMGEPLKWKFNDLKSFMDSREGQLIIPLYLQDLTDAAKANNVGVAVGGGLGAFFGLGVQTYSDRKGLADVIAEKIASDEKLNQKEQAFYEKASKSIDDKVSKLNSAK